MVWLCRAVRAAAGGREQRVVKPHHRQQYSPLSLCVVSHLSLTVLRFVAVLSPPTLLSQTFQNPPWRRTANGNNMVELTLTYTPNCISFIVENSQITVCACFGPLCLTFVFAVAARVDSEQLWPSRDKQRHLTISLSNRHTHTLAAQTLASIRQHSLLPAHIRDLFSCACCQQGGLHVNHTNRAFPAVRAHAYALSDS